MCNSCLCCGATSEKLLCKNCLSEENLETVFYELMYRKVEECTLPSIAELKKTQTAPGAEREFIPRILQLYPEEISAYYYCVYYKVIKDPRYEECATNYLNSHDWTDIKTQKILYGIINFYPPNDFVSSMNWASMVEQREDLCCDLYTTVAHYRGMIGDYDAADELLDRAKAYAKAGRASLYQNEESIVKHLEAAKAEIARWRRKPYWPATEERRRAICEFYDKKGIAHLRITRASKVAEEDFAPLKEAEEPPLTEYCAFWCASAFSLSGVSNCYQIAAVKVIEGKVTDTFQSYMKPIDGLSYRKAAAKDAGVPIETIEKADDVDLVMPRFFAFVGNATLVSTGALGDQAKALTRITRYSGIKEIQPALFDLLDYAADISPKFDLKNNTRDYLLNFFKISAGSDALSNAKANVTLFDKLTHYED